MIDFKLENPYLDASYGLSRSKFQASDVIGAEQKALPGIDTFFIGDFIQALAAGGVHINPDELPPDQLGSMIQQAWADSTIQADFQSGVYNTGDFANIAGAPSFKSYLQKALFTDPNSPLIDMGLGLKQSQGITLTPAEKKAGGPLAETVPTPFDPQYYGNQTLLFGQIGPFGAMEDGIDFGMPTGTAIYAPMSGTVIATEEGGKQNWGRRVIVQMPNGQRYAIGHLTNFSVTAGEPVNPGELLGESGGDPSDPNSGSSSGAHVEFQLMDVAGNFVDPGPTLRQIYGGVTFAKLGLSGAAGAGVSKTDAKNRLLGIDPVLNAKYAPLVSLWKQYYGTEPTVAQTLEMANIGPDVSAVREWIRGQASHIPGMNLGQYEDLRTAADKYSTETFGHGATDGIVQTLFNEGHMSPAQIRLWYDQQDVLGKMDPKTYNTIWAAMQPHLKAIYNETGGDPGAVLKVFTRGGGPPATNTQASEAAKKMTGPAVPPPSYGRDPQSEGDIP